MSFDLKSSLRTFRKHNSAFPAGQRLLNVFDSALCAALYRCDFNSYFYLRFWEKRACLRRTYLTQKQARALTKRYNADPEQWDILMKKPRTNVFLGELVRRGWIDASACEKEEFLRFAQGRDEVIVKPPALTQGLGIHKLRPADFAGDPDGLWAAVRGDLVEEVIVQHPALAAFNPASVNTVRVLTVRAGDRVGVPAAALKMGGSADSCVDNGHSHGVCAKADVESGVLCSEGQVLGGERLLRHPVTGVQIPGFCIPHWDEVLRTVRRAALLFDGIAMIGWDVAITPEGCEIIEGNPNFGVHLVQVCDDRGGIRRAVLELLQ